MKPTFTDLKDDFPNFTWISVDIQNDSSGLVKKYGVTNVPSLVVDTFKGITRHTGTDSIGYFRLLKNA
jgi:hypothetical protein